MDLQTGLLCGAIAAFSAIIIYVITVFSMKEKTYEEAIAEQRKMPEENLLLGRSTKDKAKDKKLKKSGKKVKEKTAEPEKSEQNEVQKTSAVQPSKVHVDFEEPEAEVVSEHPPKDDKKKKKKEKVKPILLNKDKLSPVVNKPQMPANHFEEIKPKDDLLQKRSRSVSREDISVKKNSETAPQDVKPPKVNPKSSENAVSSGVARQEKEKVAPLKAEQPKGVPKPEKEAEKEKAVKEKAEKPPTAKGDKNEKSTAKQEKQPTPKPERAAKSLKVDKAASEKVEKAEKISPPAAALPAKVEKNEKALEKKGEKVVDKKVEKQTAAKTEKPGNAKNEKAAGKNPEKQPEKAAVKQTVPETSATNVKASTVNTKAAPSAALPNASAGQPEAPVAKAASAPSVLSEASANATQAKEKTRKKKNELAVLQQMSGDRDGVNVSLLLPLVQKAALSRSEIQTLIDYLLNKQLNSGESDAEWIGGRADPVAKLRRQLAERERQLELEQEASKGVHAKLKELRAELNGERGQRARASANARRLDEALQAKAAEVQALTTQLQQVQLKLQEERARLRQAQEQVQQQEEGLQEQLQLQRQQAEMHIAHLKEQENALKTQVQQLRGQLAEQEQVQQQLQIEVQQQRDQALADKNMLIERGQDLARQVEELNHIRQELEHRLNSGQKHETALQYEASSLRKETEELKAQLVGYESLKNEANRLRSDNDKLSSQLLQSKELQLENQRLRDENERLAAKVVMLPELQMEALQLREENETLAAQMTAMVERPAVEGRENGDLHFPEEKPVAQKGDLAHFEKTLQQKEGQLAQLGEELEEQTSLLKKLQAEINTYKTDTITLREELEEQRRRNNDLRQKNWKAMEALSVMEKSLQSKAKDSSDSPQTGSEASEKAKLEEQAGTKQLLLRIFPSVQVEDCNSYDEWLQNFESAAAMYLEALQSRPVEQPAQQPAQPTLEPAADLSEALIESEKQNTHLQGVIAKYKTIIDDTSGMLQKLQKEVEEGEIRWRQQLQVKEAELEAVRQELAAAATTVPADPHLPNEPSEPSDPSAAPVTQSNLEDLREELRAVQRQKQELEDKLQALSSNLESLQEENGTLAQRLQQEQTQAQELNKELVKLRSLVQIGKDSLSQEHEKVTQLQQELTDKVNGVHQNLNGSSNGPASDPSPVSQSVSTSLQHLTESADSTGSGKGSKSRKKKTTKSSVKRRTLTGWFRKKIIPHKLQRKGSQNGPEEKRRRSSS